MTVSSFAQFIALCFDVKYAIVARVLIDKTTRQERSCCEFHAAQGDAMKVKRKTQRRGEDKQPQTEEAQRGRKEQRQGRSARVCVSASLVPERGRRKEI